MPLPEGVIPHPDRPFITVRTATRFNDPDAIRRYETREECLADLHEWQDSSLVRQDPLYHLGQGYRGDNDTYTFEVYENGELRLQLDIDRLGQRQTGPWAQAAEQRAPGPVLERPARTMTDTPERAWDRIKADYAAVFEAAGGNLNAVPYQDGYPALHELAQNAADTAHYPDRQADKLKALLDTLDLCAARKTAISDLHVDIARAREGLDGLIRDAGTLHNPRIERDAYFPDWSNERASVIARWNHALADPDLKQHLPRFEQDTMKDHIDRLTDPEIPTVFHPRALAGSHELLLSVPMDRIAAEYERTLKDVGGDTNLLPYSQNFGNLQFSLQRARETCADFPDRLAHIESLAAQLDVVTRRKADMTDAAQNLSDVSDELVRHINWSKENRKPVHEAPGFSAWRDKADGIASRCEDILQDPRLAPHFKRAGASEESARAAVSFLREDRFRKPPSPEEIAAQRQARARARADSREESFSMSA